ncbi:NosD domain-containing protein [Candidatus Harpocratesius sp.]
MNSPEDSFRMNFEFINQTLENLELEFYQEDSVLFRGNICKNVTINVMDSGSVEIIDNIFKESFFTTLTLWNCSNLVVQNNTFQDIYDTPIHVIETIGAEIENNSILLPEMNPNPQSLNFGMEIDRSPQSIIKGNIINAPLGDGLILSQSPNSLIQNNLIHESGFGGVSLMFSSDTIIFENTIVNNSMLITDVPQLSSAVMLSVSPRTNITKNLIEKSSNAGIWIESSEETIVNQNTITKHEIVGIFVGSSPRSKITFNKYAQNGGTNFVEQDQSPDCIIEGNEEIKLTDDSDDFNNSTESNNYPNGDIYDFNNKKISSYTGISLIFIISIYLYFYNTRKKQI